LPRSAVFFGIALKAMLQNKTYRTAEMFNLLGRLSRDEEGAALVEYGLLVALIATVGVVAVTALGTEISAAFSEYAADLAFFT
jgi:pilus assembly protein Flp/PilA